MTGPLPAPRPPGDDSRDQAGLTGPGLPDYHTHTHRCGHATGEAVEYVERAAARGLAGIGVCDHLPLVSRRDPELAMDISELDGYVTEVLELKRAYPGFVLLGIEADYEPETIGAVSALLDAYPFDYVIGSVHYLDGWAFDDPRDTDGWDGRSVFDVYVRYFQRVAEAAETGTFTMLGHLDLVKKFGHRPDETPTEAMRSLVERIARAGVAVEVNTAGLRKPVGEAYPSADLLRMLASAEVPITFGSDAHRPGEVGAGFEEALVLARQAGYSDYLHLTPEAGLGARAERRPLPGVGAA